VFGRTSKSYLPYMANTTDGSFHSSYVSYQAGFYSNTADKIQDDANPYAVSSYEDSPLGRIKEQGAPGASWQPGTGHTTRNTFSFNLAGEVRKFNTDATSSTTYVANILSKTEQLDENGNKIIIFQDFGGKTLLKRQQLDEIIGGSTVNFLDTYYLYDEMDRIKYVVSPKGVAQLQSGGWTFTQMILDQYVYQFVYDARGRIVEKKVPSQGWRYFAYDKLNRLVLAQDAYLKALNKWIFFKYDNRGQPIMQGLYLNATQTSRASVQTILDGLYPTFPNTTYYETRGTILHGYTKVSFPVTNADNSALEIMTVNYFDGYDFDFNGTDDFGYTYQSLPGEKTTNGLSNGLPTGSKRIILGTSNWLYSYVFYDKYARPIQVRSNNHLSATVDNLSTNVYDFEKTTYRKTYHNAGAGKVTTVLNRFYYTVQAQLYKVYQTNNSDAEQLVVQYEYNELGQVVAKKLHSKAGDGSFVSTDPLVGQPGVLYNMNITSSSYSSSQATYRATQSITLSNGFQVASGNTFSAKIGYSQADAQAYNLAHEAFAQVVDYRYNIRGWLTSINNAQLTVDSRNGDSNDFFGMELLYDQSESGLNSTAGDKRFDGTISATKWKGAGAAAGADNQRSYKYAYDKSGKMKSANWQVSQAGAWTKEVGVQNEALTYDENGNILSLKRKHNLRGLSGITLTATAELTDDLAYTYDSGDQLSKVEDAVAMTIGKGDFKDADHSTTEYTYNSHGDITLDKNKGISNITYNHLHKPVLINFTDGHKIEYIYDAAGTKLTMKTYTTSAALQTTTDYVNGFIYTNGNLSFFSSPEGRVVKNGSNLEYQYAIADHQGNTRVIFTSAAPVATTVTATYEDAAQVAELNIFTNSYPTGGAINGIATNAHTGTKSQLLNGGYAGMVGVAKSFKVYPGDQVKIEAYARYNAPTGSTSQLANFAQAILSAFGLPIPVGGEAGTASSALQGWGLMEAGGLADGTPNDGSIKAFVNIILFDKDYKFLDVTYAAVTSTGSPALVSASYTVKEAGYAYMYISNEHATLTDVYYDDVSMTVTPTSVVQYSEYYPFGLQTANSWTRDNTTNNFLYDAGNELNDQTGWYEMFFRGYDPALGRMLQVDPLATKYLSYTPYQYALNNPALLNDPFGDRISDRGDEVWYNLGGDAGNPDRGMGGGGGWSSDMWELIDANLKTVPVSFFTTVMYSNIMSMFRSGAEGQIYGYDGKHEAYGFYVTAGMMGVLGFMLSLRGIVNSANNELDEYVFVSHFIPYQLHGTDHETNGGSLRLLPYNQAIDGGLTTLGFFNDAVNTSGEITSYHVAKGLQKITTRQATGLSRLTKITGGVGFGITLGVAGYEYASGEFDTHSVIDVAVGGGLLIVGGIAMIVGAPALLTGVAVGGLVYGVASAVGSDLVDNATGHWGRDLVYPSKTGGK